MSFFDFFKTNQNNSPQLGKLHEKIVHKFPEIEEVEQTKLACISGLLARVAHSDFNVHPDEIEEIKKSLSLFNFLTESQIEFVTNVAIDMIIELSGLENHMYCHPLVEIMKPNERFEVLRMCFAIAASDNSVEESECEEIRQITSSLCLEHKDFIAAKIEVASKLKALKKD